MVDEIAHLLGLIGAYLRAHVRRILEYRANFFIGLFAIMSRHVINLAALAVIFFHTSGLGDWSPYEVVYLYGYVALIVAFWHLLFANTLRVEFLVRDAGFDRYLVRPLPPLLQLLFYYFDDDAIGDFIPAIACLAVASRQLQIVYSWDVILLFTLGLAGGVLVHFGIHLLLSAWSFWFIRSRALINLFSEVRRFSEYPLSIFPVSLQWVFTLVVPIAFAGFYPAERLLSVTTLSALAWLALPLGLITCAIGATVWHAGLARYQSAGS